MADIQIIPARPDHAQALEAVQRVVYGYSKSYDAPDSLYARNFLSWIAIFPEAQFAAVDTETGRVVGHTAGMLIDFDPSQPFLQPWLVTTGDGMLTTHKPDGEWMYGVESAVLPDYQGEGVGSKLYAARFDVARRLNLRGMVAGSTIMDYHRYADTLSPEDYVREVAAGRLYDNNLTKQLKKGFRLHNVIPNYVSDALSRGYGAAIVWNNPDYQPR
jgi:GNAT superfamily N-acetyltransferase